MKRSNIEKIFNSFEKAFILQNSDKKEDIKETKETKEEPNKDNNISNENNAHITIIKKSKSKQKPQRALEPIFLYILIQIQENLKVYQHFQ